MNISIAIYINPFLLLYIYFSLKVISLTMRIILFFYEFFFKVQNKTLEEL